FYSLGMVGALYALPYYAALRRTGAGAPSPQSTSLGSGSTIAALFRIPSFPFVLWLLYTWLSDFVHGKFSLSMGEAGLSSTAWLQGATLGGLLLGGALADRLYRRARAARLWIVAAGLLICGPCVHLIGNLESLPLTKLAMAGFGLGAGLAISNFFAGSFD